ncbi:MAG: phytanoyl-CoA dioxygenase family protein [Candidatus Thiodiazotropha sp.]|jgi:ectoine hydroxylase-related dioxygenase (phytanoyl-CoA dioxygenase family)
MRQEYSRDGYYLIQDVFSDESIITLKKELSNFEGKSNNYGIRDLMNKVPYIKRMALSNPLIEIAKIILGENARPVRSVFFDKLKGANWNVAWHQDTSIALKDKHETSGFGPWTKKQGVVHTEPPVEYLANTLTLRIHLDKANTETGVLRVVPGTHKDGRVESSKIVKIVENSTVIECEANPGDVLLMNPLLFHSSRKAVHPDHRRIIHIEYSAMALPHPLKWFECA